MSKQGQYNYKGIDFQAKAALALFLQHLRLPSFLYIQLEAPNFEDFNLVFNDGRKIICESKDWKRNLSFSHLKMILQSVLKKNILQKNDEILVICTKLDRMLKDKVHHMKYWGNLVASEFQKRGFKNTEIAILDRVRFWEIRKREIHLVIYSLFSELLDFWLPQDELERIINNVLVKRIYDGSTTGDIFRRSDILSEIESIRENARKNSGHFDNERVEVEDQLKNLIVAIENNKSPTWAPHQISALSSKPDLVFFVLKKFESRQIDDIKQWKNLWQLHKVYRFSFSLFKIFENNLHAKKNKRYVLQFIKDNIGEIKRFYQHDYFEVDTVRIISKIIAEDGKFLSEAFEIVKKLVHSRKDDIFYIKTRESDFWKKEKICELLKKIYDNVDDSLKNKIYELIISSFNLTGDEGTHSHYTPRKIFEILRSWLDVNFEENLPVLTKVLSEQYDKHYQYFSKTLRFKGWEHYGGTTCFWGNQYAATDRHFVTYTLKPAFWDYYEGNKIRAWEFIINNCITSTDKVKKNHPDFLNRASISIILEEYKSRGEKISGQAFKILREFALSRKGIPHKSDLIYQELRGNFPDEKKWKLVKVSVDKYKIPVSPFVEQIVLELAKHGDKRAKKILKNWIKSKDYYQKGRIFEENIVMIISQFLDDSFEEGIGMFKDFIGGDYFLKKMDSFDAFTIARLLNKIIKKDIETGSEILETLSRKRELTDNEQIVLYNALVDEGNSKQENKKVLVRIYETFLDPFLNSLGNDIEKIENKITRPQSREAIVQFADALAKQGKIREAIRIVKVFINDSDPCTPKRKNPEDPEGKYDEHKKIEQGEDVHPITCVRGWCAWVLMNCAVLDGRDYIPENIDLTEKLTKDRNYYIKHMACVALSQLAQSRLTVLPEKRDVLFLSDNVKKALKMSKKIEGIAFNLLKDISKLSINVQKVLGKSILKVFNHIRALNQDNALKLIKTLEKFPEEAVAEAGPLFIYFAEFRRNNFQDWKWKMPGLYDDLDNFDSKVFQQFLEKIIKKKNPKINSQFSWHFYELIEKSVPDKLEVKNFLKYDKAFEISYKYLDVISNYYHQQTFSHIYRFIEDNFEKRPKECYQLWRKCLGKERVVIKKKVQGGKADEVYYWPNYENEKILIKIKENDGVNEFLDSFEFLLDYPKEVIIGDINEVVKILERLPKRKRYIEQVNGIFNKLITRNSSFYDIREKWRKK